MKDLVSHLIIWHCKKMTSLLPSTTETQLCPGSDKQPSGTKMSMEEISFPSGFLLPKPPADRGI
jgi:hypothetical protein